MDVVEVTYHNQTKKNGVKIKIKRPIFKRNNSLRGSKKMREVQINAMQNTTGLKVALIVLNSDYSSFSALQGVEADGKLMEEMLLCYDDVVTMKDVANIDEAVMDFCAKHKYKKVERLHFHYSGHGVENAKIEIDPSAYTVEENKKTFVGLTPTGGCMIGCAGELYSVHDIKLELLKCNPTWLTLTLDCCRSSGRQRGQTSKEYVIPKVKTVISNEDQEKIAVIYGTSDLHPASDANTFTQELHSVFKKEKLEIPILEIVSKVNQSWKDRGIRQICKLDFVDVGSNWKSYMWPNPHPFRPIMEVVSDSFVANEEDTADIGGKMEEVLQRMKTLEVDKKADAERIQKLESEVSEINEINGKDEFRKRKRAKRSTLKHADQ